MKLSATTSTASQMKSSGGTARGKEAPEERHVYRTFRAHDLKLRRSGMFVADAGFVTMLPGARLLGRFNARIDEPARDLQAAAYRAVKRHECRAPVWAMPLHGITVGRCLPSCRSYRACGLPTASFYKHGAPNGAFSPFSPVDPAPRRMP